MGEALVSIPTTLTSGDTWAWTADYGDYPAGTWTATAYFENSAQSFSVAASASGTTHAFAATATTTAAFVAGRYFVQVRVVNGATKHIAEVGWCEVKADPAASALVDHRSWARRTLDAIEAFLEGNATTAQQSIEVAGRSISRYPLPELLQLRAQLRGEVNIEERGATSGLGRNIKVRYGNP